MKKTSLIIGIPALVVSVCAIILLVKVILPPSPEDDGNSVPTETASFPASANASVLAESQPTSDPQGAVTAAGGIPAAPAPVDLIPDSITALVNRDYKLTEDYVPEDLVVPDVRFTFSYYDDKKLMRAEAAAALEELFAAGDADGIKLYGVSAYRSFTRQYTIYATNLITKGVTHTNRYSAAPGASEHQTGLVIDVSSDSAGQTLEEIFGTTKEGIWLAENAFRFGFIIRYPKDREDLTGYYYEPWHIRYVGKELAAYLQENDLTLDEYYGYEPLVPFSTLADTPLIDTTAERYLSLYQSLVKPTAPPSEPNTAPNGKEPPVTEPIPASEPSSETTEGTDLSEEAETTEVTETTESQISEEISQQEPSESSDTTDTSDSPVPSEPSDSSEAAETTEPSVPAISTEATESAAPSESVEQEPTAAAESSTPEPSGASADS